MAQIANPEREAYMNKYALEKRKEEFEKYKKDVGEKEANEPRPAAAARKFGQPRVG